MLLLFLKNRRLESKSLMEKVETTRQAAASTGPRRDRDDDRDDRRYNQEGDSYRPNNQLYQPSPPNTLVAGGQANLLGALQNLLSSAMQGTGGSPTIPQPSPSPPSYQQAQPYMQMPARPGQLPQQQQYQQQYQQQPDQQQQSLNSLFALIVSTKVLHVVLNESRLNINSFFSSSNPHHSKILNNHHTTKINHNIPKPMQQPCSTFKLSCKPFKGTLQQLRCLCPFLHKLLYQRVSHLYLHMYMVDHLVILERWWWGVVMHQLLFLPLRQRLCRLNQPTATRLPGRTRTRSCNCCKALNTRKISSRNKVVNICFCFTYNHSVSVCICISIFICIEKASLSHHLYPFILYGISWLYYCYHHQLCLLNRITICDNISFHKWYFRTSISGQIFCGAHCSLLSFVKREHLNNSHNYLGFHKNGNGHNEIKDSKGMRNSLGINGWVKDWDKGGNCKKWRRHHERPSLSAIV